MASPYSHNIAGRMRDYFERQIAWFNEAKLEYTSITDFLTTKGDIDPVDLKTFIEKVGYMANDSRVLQDEFQALMREWDSAEEVPDIERVEIQVLAKEAQVLSADLTTLYTRYGELAQLQADATRDALMKMQRQSASLHKYKTDDDDSRSLLDHNA